MFKNDLSYSNNQKAQKFTAESKNFLVSLNDAFSVVKYISYLMREKAFLDNQKDLYVHNTNFLITQFKNNYVNDE